MSSDRTAGTSGQDVSAPVQRSAVHDVLAAPGRPLDAEERREFEGPLGADLSEVRVHTGGAASSSATAIGARAYTSGNDVVFGGPVDRHTLAHELTHVVQQRQGPVAGTDNGDGLRVSDPGDRFEREAEATAEALTSPTSPIQRAPGGDPPAETGPAGTGVVVQRAQTAAEVEARRKRLGWRPRPEADITDQILGWRRDRPSVPAAPAASRPSETDVATEEETDIADERIGWGPPATFFPAGSSSADEREDEPVAGAATRPQSEVSERAGFSPLEWLRPVRTRPGLPAGPRPRPGRVGGVSPPEWLRPVRTRPGVPVGPRPRPRPGRVGGGPEGLEVSPGPAEPRPVRTRPGLPAGPRPRPDRPGPARVAAPQIEEVLREDPQPPAVPEKDFLQPPAVPEKDDPQPPDVPEKDAKTVADRFMLGGDDQILKIGEPRDPSKGDAGVAFDDNIVIDFLSNSLKNVLSPRDLQIAEQRWAATLSAAALQPMLSSMTRGDVLLVPLNVGGWTGRIKVSARVVQQAKTQGTATVEFEAGGDRFTSGVGLSENRDRREGQVVGTVSPTGVSVGLGVRVLRDDVTGETVSSGGRSFARTKSKEQAPLFYTEIQMQFDFSDVKGPRRLGVGPRRQVPETGSKPIGATVARPPAGEAAAAGFWPPARVQETRALGGMDVVTDVRALDKSLRPSASGVSALLGTKDDRTSLEAWGSGLPDWPTVRKDILAHLTMSSLQRDLKAMMVGKGIEVPLSKNLGSVWIGAEANWMSYRRTTKETEFNVGSDSSRARASSEGRNTRGEATVPIGISPLGETAVTGSLTVTPVGEYGRENREGDQASARTGTALKMKVPGAVFDGRAMLTFSHSGVGSQANAMISFRAIIDAAELESKGADAPGAWSAGGGPRKHSMAAPVFAPNTKIRAAADGLLGGAEPGGGTGLPADVVILDVLAGEKGEHNPVADEVADWGKGYFGASWADLRPVILGTFSRERLAASIPAMTRKVPLQSPPLIRAEHDPAWVSGTAKLEDLSFVRELSSKAELNVLNDVATSSNAQKGSYYGGGGQIQGGPRVPLPAETTFSPSFLVGARQRQRTGMRQAVAIANTANGKFEKPMVVFIGEATVDLRLTESGQTPGRIMKAPVRFVVALPKAYTKESLAPGSADAGQEPAEEGAAGNNGAAAPAPARAPLAVGPPLRVTKNGQIGASDVIVRLDNDLAVVNALKAELQKDLGVNWHTFEAKVLPVFDRAAIQPLVPALTHGQRLGTSVSTKTANGTDVAAVVSIIAARASMTEHVQTVKKFEFEVGSDSAVSTGTSSGSRTRFTGRTQLAASAGAGHVTSTGAGGATVDIFSEGSVNSAGGLVTRTKMVEEAELYKGEIRFLIELNLGGQVKTVAASMPGQFAFPARDTSKPPAPEKKKDEPAKNDPEASAKKDSGAAKKPADSRDQSVYRQPARITSSRRLGSTDVVLELFPQKAGAAASRLSPVRRAEPSAALIVEQLAHEGSQIFGSPENWAAVRPVLVDELNPITLKPRLKSMMTGQGLRIDLGKHGRVTVTASVEGEMSHVENTRDPAEFNSGATSGLVLGGTADGRPSAETRIAYQAIGGMTGNSSPSALEASITPGFTTTYERGKDLTADYLTSRQRGIGTKSKVPGSIFKGVALLHFRFDQPRSLASTINPEFSTRSKRRDQRIADLTKAQSRGGLSRADQEELRALLMEQSENIRLRIGMRQNPAAYAGEQFAPKNIDKSIQGAEKAHERLRGTPGADEAEVGQARTQLAELAAAKDMMLQDRARITGSRMGLARVPFTVLIETKDALKVENEQVDAVEPAALRLPDVEKGLRPDHIVRDLPDVHSLYDLLDAVGPQIYGSAWKTHGPMVHKDFSLEKLRAGLAGMTIGRPLTSHQFSVRLRPARIEATAEVVAQGFERVEPKADVAWVGENTSRFRERERVSKLSQFIGQIGASLGLGGVRFAGGSSHRTRVGTEAQTGGRLITNAKVTQSQTHLSGHVKFNFTFYPGPLGKSSITHSGVVPFTISVPTADTKEVAKTQLPEKAEVEWDGPTPRYPEAADALAGIENDLDRGPEGAACIVQVRRPGQNEARQYRVVKEVVNKRSRITWYETRSNAPTSAPWNARTIKAYFLPPPPPPKDRV
ncbi:DUF4157 domain-containing protein [Pseudonocardia yunnanensis]|uniref:eCIS core domain-containing protein n=1 Tax=Pseudonocardia yunnanensis TaxID=58107 RepID=UPI0031D0676D